MMRKPKLMVIGLDSVSLTLLDEFADHCPAIRRLMRTGACGHAIPEYPVYTPTNWAALCTGASSSTTGAEGWYNTAAGRRLSTFDSRAITCETIFDSAARAGMRTLAIAYPGAYPPRSARNMVLSPLDRGLVSNCLVPGKILDVRAPDAQGAFRFTLVEQPKGLSGAAMAKAVGATEDGGDAGGSRRKAAVRDVGGVLVREGPGRWKLGLGENPAKADIPLRHGQWSGPIPVRVASPGRPGRCVVRVMVFDAGKRLGVSEAYDIGMLGRPVRLARAVYDSLGPPTEHSVFYHEMTRLFRAGRSDATIARLAADDLAAQARWISRAAARVMRTDPYDVFYLHHHYPDSVLHAYLPAADGAPGYAPKQRKIAREGIALSMAVCDRLVADLVELAGPRTTVLVISDHGNATARYGCDVAARLVETGLTKLTGDGRVNRRGSLAWNSEKIWHVWIDVNAKPDTKRYEQLQAKVIDALLDWKTPDGERVVALALRKKDAHLLGYFGTNCGDVAFHFNSGFSWFGCPKGKSVGRAAVANHGPQMPVTFSKVSDNMGFFILNGPGVRKGVRWDMSRRAPVYLKDMVPTICHLSGVPAPKNVNGAARYGLMR